MPTYRGSLAESADKPPIDAILQKVLDAVPFRLLADGDVAMATWRWRRGDGDVAMATWRNRGAGYGYAGVVPAATDATEWGLAALRDALLEL